jgi:hypothetical protein
METNVARRRGKREPMVALNSFAMMTLSRTLVAALLLVFAFPSYLLAQSNEASEVFELQDFLGRTWRNESVGFTASWAQLTSARAGLPLIGPDQKPVLYQIVQGSGGAPPAIEFLADLEPFEKRAYHFARATGHAAAATDLKIEETSDAIRLINSRIGISIRKKLAAGQGPIESIRLASGHWIGNSLLHGAPPVLSYSVSLVARGPVFAEITCDIKFVDARSWQLRLRINANEPVVLVNEKFSLNDSTSFQLMLSPQFSPDGLFYRFGKASSADGEGKLATWKIPATHDAAAFVLEPWLHWSERERQGTWFALYNEQRSDLLSIAARTPSLWVDPERLEQRASSQTFLTSDRDGLKWTLALKDGARQWMIAALDKNTSLAPLRDKNLYQAPLPQQYQIKYSDFPLDRIKDYITRWRGDESDHPHLIVTRNNITALCRNFRPDPAELASYRTAPIVFNRIDEPIIYFLCTHDLALGQHLASTAVSWVQDAVNMLVRQDALVTLGFAPHQQTAIATAMNLADVIWSSGYLSAELRDRLKAQVAILAYTVNRDDYWSPPRGFAGNPNMTSTVAAYRALLGAMIPAHPIAAAWVANGIKELKYQLDHWSDDDGGWLEAPHYAMVSYDCLLGVFLMAHNAGFGDYLYDPKMKKIAEWFAKISTPPDPQLDGHRHLPPIGNTYMREPTGEFGLIASLWKLKDPEFAANMQWMYQQQGSPAEPGLGGFYPTLAGFRQLLINPFIVGKPPTYRSELFSRTGVVLRNHFPSERETQLYLIAGANHEHYDQDSGSFTLWGKGHLIANDFGYGGNMPADDHNMVVAADAPGGDIMQVAEFSSGPNLDYVRGVKNGAWTRQIAFIKDADPLGPNYFVISDSLKTPAWRLWLTADKVTTWRLWLTADKVTTSGQSVVAVGKDDVNTDIFFVEPAGVSLRTEQKTRQTSGIAAGDYGILSTTQTGLIATSNGGAGFTAVVYPRLKREPAPVVTELAGGKVIKMQSGAGTDYVFLASAPFAYRDQDISFSGTVGLVQIRSNEANLSLGALGKLTAFGKTLNRPQ